jgi:hypothetical protein
MAFLRGLATRALTAEDSTNIYVAMLQERSYVDSVGDVSATAVIGLRTLGFLTAIDSFYIQHHRGGSAARRKITVAAGLNTVFGKGWEFDGIGAWGAAHVRRTAITIDVNSVNERPQFLLGVGRVF